MKMKFLNRLEDTAKLVSTTSEGVATLITLFRRESILVKYILRYDRPNDFELL